MLLSDKQNEYSELTKYFEFTVDTWEQFIGCNDSFSYFCQKNWIKTRFHIIFKNVGTSWQMKVKMVTVEDIILVHEYEQRNSFK
jgi:hypothetical protein